MMKKGFTLAEVLITLAIIGVVATMVLPGVLTSTSEQQAKTALKKAVNVLTNIAKINEAIDGYDYTGTNSADATEDSQSIYGMIVRHGDVDFAKISDYNGASATTDLPGAEGNYTIFFRDGSYVSFPTGDMASAPEAAARQADGLPFGVPVLYDMNGAKGPNFLSNCDGEAAMQADDENGEQSHNANDENACNTKANRVIKDQFSLKLRGAVVQPNGDAARWLYNN